MRNPIVVKSYWKFDSRSHVLHVEDKCRERDTRGTSVWNTRESSLKFSNRQVFEVRSEIREYRTPVREKVRRFNAANKWK